MSRKLLLCMSLILGALLVGAVAGAQEPVTVAPVNSAVNVRSGPGLAYLLRGVLPLRGSLVATGRNGFDPARGCVGSRADLEMWLRVQFYELEGWVNRCVVRVSGDVAALPVVEPSLPATESDDPQARFVFGRRLDPPDGSLAGVFTRANVFLRAEPSIESEAKRQLSATVEVYVIGRSAGNGWAQVNYRGQTGWIASYLLSLPTGWERAVPVTG